MPHLQDVTAGQPAAVARGAGEGGPLRTLPDLGHSAETGGTRRSHDQDPLLRHGQHPRLRGERAARAGSSSWKAPTAWGARRRWRCCTNGWRRTATRSTQTGLARSSLVGPGLTARQAGPHAGRHHPEPVLRHRLRRPAGEGDHARAARRLRLPDRPLHLLGDRARDWCAGWTAAGCATCSALRSCPTRCSTWRPTWIT